MSQEMVITLSIVALISLVVGFFIGRNIGGSAGHGDSKALAEAKKELADYKQSVSEHFGKTADLVDNLTQSYKDVFDHLGGSAKSLLSEEQVKHHLSSRAAKAVTLTYIADEATDNSMQANQDESQSVVDKASKDAEKMAKSMHQADTETSNMANNQTAENVVSNREKRTQVALDKAAAAVKVASQEKNS